jgi:BASS family bile acid:Na+ symporter
MLLRFIKNWALPISMTTGALGYVIGRELPLSADVKGDIVHGIEWLQPVLLFCMLFVTFCKVPPSALKPKMLHLWLLLIQCTFFVLSCLLLYLFPQTEYRLLAETFLLVMICPTATACAVVTSKLGGDAGLTTSYTILVCIVAAVMIPIFLPLASARHGMAFLPTLLLILKNVFPLLLAPLFLAWGVRYFFPRLLNMILSQKDLGFHMWTVALSLAIAVTVRALFNSSISIAEMTGIAVVSLAGCLLQFWLGKAIGGHYGFRLEGGQALGQKNTIFAIWLGYTFLSPISATAGGFYSIWHNLVNTYQLYKYRKVSG